MTDDEYIASLHREHEKEMKRFKIILNILFSGIAVCIGVLLVLILT